MLQYLQSLRADRLFQSCELIKGDNIMTIEVREHSFDIKTPKQHSVPEGRAGHGFCSVGVLSRGNRSGVAADTHDNQGSH